ncbi:MAG: DUF3616 domain-containing protein [Propionibacteriaceae bacterium]|nr:DUF3616 domain-containing protein [Propionibacteriaceae bacterium]
MSNHGHEPTTPLSGHSPASAAESTWGQIAATMDPVEETDPLAEADPRAESEPTNADPVNGKPAPPDDRPGTDREQPGQARRTKKTKNPKKSGRKDAKATLPPEPPTLLGSAKAVETMFRNAIRAELDMIALAATKANIMISLNGFIISALMISGAFLFNSSPTFLVPAGVFMISSAASIVFALFAASPQHSSYREGLRAWWNRLRGRREPEAADELNLLIYEERVKLDPDDYWDKMQELLRNRDEIYHQMSQHLYWLGEMASKKFKMLNVAYTVFRWGLLGALATFLIFQGTLWAFPSLTNQRPAPVPNRGISQFVEIYEPSAVQQLPDGRILVVEDEPARAMNLLTIAEDGSLVEDNAADLKLTRSFGRQLNDLEGLSIDGDQIYAITSHSGDAKGKRDPDREQLIRFRIQGSQAGNIATYSGLRDDLTNDPKLAAALTAAGGGEKLDWAALNIEGLAYHHNRLMIGLRDPKAGDYPVIVPLNNPDEVFEGKKPLFGDPAILDLQGGGIRALSYDPVLGAFLIVNEIEDEHGDKVSRMWRWTGNPAIAPELLALPNLINLNNIESIDSVKFGGENRLLIMSDDGDAKKNIPAKYLVLDYDQLPPQGEPVPSQVAADPEPAPTPE